MKNPFPTLLLTSIALVLSGCGKREASVEPGAAIQPARETSFAEVTRQLDPGGSVYGYLATDQWLAGLSTNVAQLGEALSTLPGVSGSDRQQIDRAVRLASHAIATTGIEQLTGIGVSGIQITPELHRTKLIFHHKPGRGEGPLWNLMGQRPHALEGLSLLTTQTALAAFGDLDVPMLWRTLEEEARQSGIPELTRALQEWPRTFEQQTQIPWARFLSSLGGEMGLVLTLDESRPIALPLGEAVQLPEPGLLIAIRVKDELLYERISGELKKGGQAAVTDERGLKMTALRLPIPLPLDLQLTAANAEGYLFLASSPAMVRNALDVRAGRQAGLAKSTSFAGLLKYLPDGGNQFCYVDRRFSGTIQAVQRAMLAKQDAGLAQSEFLSNWLLKQKPTFGLSIGRRTATGWESVSVGNQDSAAALVATPAIAGAAMVSAMMLPALSKAKNNAQSIQCVNNLKQVGLAFRIWAADNDDHFPFHVSSARGGTLEACNPNDAGYDLASYRHFQVMSNELSTPKILVCPEDSSRRAAADFAVLQPENVSYLVRSGRDVDEADPEAILIYCPIHHHTGLADGSVRRGTK